MFRNTSEANCQHAQVLPLNQLHPKSGLQDAKSESLLCCPHMTYSISGDSAIRNKLYKFNF